MLLGSPTEPWSGTITVTRADADAGTADLTVDVAGASGDVPNVTYCPLRAPLNQ